MMRARILIEESSADRLVIRDVGVCTTTVTNDAAAVVEWLAPQLEDRRLFYFDTDGRLDEILVVAGRFAGFAPGQVAL